MLKILDSGRFMSRMLNFFRPRLLLIGLILCALHPNSVFAQSRISYGVMAGANNTFGVHALGEGKIDWSAGASIIYSLPGSASFEGDLVYDRFRSYCPFACERSSDFGPKPVKVKQGVRSGTVNAVWAFPAKNASAVVPFLIGGGGLYHFVLRYSSQNDVDEGWTSPGIDLGAGLKIPVHGLHTSVDARWNHLFDKSKTGDNSTTSFLRIVVAIHTG